MHANVACTRAYDERETTLMTLRALRVGVLTLLTIALLDELVFGAREAACPAIRTDLDLSYAQIGLLPSVPMCASAILEPVFSRQLGRLLGATFPLVIGPVAESYGLEVAHSLLLAGPLALLVLVPRRT